MFDHRRMLLFVSALPIGLRRSHRGRFTVPLNTPDSPRSVGEAPGRSSTSDWVRWRSIRRTAAVNASTATYLFGDQFEADSQSAPCLVKRTKGWFTLP